MLKTFSFCILLAAAMGCVSKPNSSGNLSLVGGTPDSEQLFKSVFVWTSEGIDLQQSYCTATKIGPRHFLSAAHCVLEQHKTTPDLDLGPWKRVDSMNRDHLITYSFRRTLAAGDQYETLKIKKLILHPQVNDCLDHPEQHVSKCEWRTPFVDVAVIEIEPTGTFASAPSTALDLSDVSANRSAFMMGYGSEKEGDEQDEVTLPRLKYGLTFVTRNAEVLASLVGTEAETHGFPNLNVLFGVITDHSTGQGINLGSGDSGGPMLDSQTLRVIGVNSDGMCPLDHLGCQITNNSTFARLSNSQDADIATWLQMTLVNTGVVF